MKFSTLQDLGYTQGILYYLNKSQVLHHVSRFAKRKPIFHRHYWWDTARHHYLEQARAVFICLSFRTFLKYKFSWHTKVVFVNCSSILSIFLVIETESNGQLASKTTQTVSSVSITFTLILFLENSWVWLIAVLKPNIEVQCVSKKWQLYEQTFFSEKIHGHSCVAVHDIEGIIYKSSWCE